MMKTRYLSTVFDMYIHCKSMPSFIHKVHGGTYLEKGMSGFYEYTPQRPHACSIQNTHTSQNLHNVW